MGVHCSLSGSASYMSYPYNSSQGHLMLAVQKDLLSVACNREVQPGFAAQKLLQHSRAIQPSYSCLAGSVLACMNILGMCHVAHMLSWICAELLWERVWLGMVCHCMNNSGVLFLTDLFSEGHLVVTTMSTSSPRTSLQGCLIVTGGIAWSQEKKVVRGIPKEKQNLFFF